MNLGNFTGTNGDSNVTLLNGGSLTLTLGNNNALRNTNSAAGRAQTVQFGTGASSLTAGGWTPGAATPLQIDFAADAFNSTFTISNGSAFDQTEWETYWTNGNLTVDGGNVGNFSDHFTVTGGTLTMIPEPSVGLLLLGSMAGFFLIRRRARA